MHPILFEIGGLEIGSYALTALLALIAGVAVFRWLGRRDGHDPQGHLELGLWAFIIAILASKVFGGLLDPHPDGFVATLRMMLRFAGHFYIGFLAGVTFLILAFRRRGIPLLEGLDELVPGLALAHAIGRVGCFLVGCCYGARCDLPWAVTFTSERAHEISGVPLHVPLHPTQLYELVAELLIFGLLLLLHLRFRVFRGATFLAYVVLYGIARFLLEFLRDDPRGTFGSTSLPTSQGLAIPLVIGAAIAWILLWRRRETVAS